MDLEPVYAIQRNATFPDKWDVVRNKPTIVSQSLRQGEAEALAFALNAQIDRIEVRTA